MARPSAEGKGGTSAGEKEEGKWKEGKERRGWAVEGRERRKGAGRPEAQSKTK